MHIISIIYTCIFLSLLSTSISAEIVKLENNNMVIVADYLEGTDKKNPVIILHGLLQTHEFSTVNRLATTLNESGYTVVSPTLSLGISNRKQSLSCEAIHTHSMDSDTAELKQWINWLQKKSGKKVNIIGHSAGGPTVLNYLEKNKNDIVKHVILISLAYYASGPTAYETKEHEKMAHEHIMSTPGQIHNYALNYCKNYPSYAENFLSYYKWNTDKVSEVVGKFSHIISIIIGTEDKRIDSNWRINLNKKHHNVISIDGANHFFDQSHEFDLNDTIESLLNK